MQLYLIAMTLLNTYELHWKTSNVLLHGGRLHIVIKEIQPRSKSFIMKESLCIKRQLFIF